MDDRIRGEKISATLDEEIRAFTRRLIQERIDSGQFDVKFMSFAEMENISHEIGQRVARGLGATLSDQQSELWSDDYSCPTCGLECEAVKHPRTVQTVDGSTEIVELKSFCPKCRRNCFPVRHVSGLGSPTFSPRVREKILTAPAETHSCKRAAIVLLKIGEISMSSRQINRITDDVGRQLREQQQQRVELHQNKRLPVEVLNAPDLAVVEFDGGRIRTREPGHGSGTHEPAWKESKTAVFMRMHSQTSENDPAPEPPPSLLNRDKVGKLANEGAFLLCDSPKMTNCLLHRVLSRTVSLLVADQ